MFGFDSAMFGALQVTPSWLGTFGTTVEKGKPAVTALQQSLLNSLPWIGKLFGIVISEPLNEKYGYKVSLIIACIIQTIGVLIESKLRDASFLHIRDRPLLMLRYSGGDTLGCVLRGSSCRLRSYRV